MNYSLLYKTLILLVKPNFPKIFKKLKEFFNKSEEN